MSLENEPAGEAARIAHVVELTLKQMEARYGTKPPFRRGVHAKDHGCVKAKFTVRKDLPRHLQIGVFAKPGKEYDAWIRFSNADVLDRADTAAAVAARSATATTPEVKAAPPAHGSRGMAIKLLDVAGDRLLAGDTTKTQDFLMVNQQVFAFANVADYEVLSQVLLDDKDVGDNFGPKLVGSGAAGVLERAKATGAIVEGVRKTLVKSPVETRYFSAAPFLFGTNRVMKYSVTPTSKPSAASPDISNRDYLRAALAARLKAGSKNVTFEFQVQLQDACEIESNVDEQIESAHTLWPGENFPFETLAVVTIEPQDINAEDRKTECEKLVFNPWQGIKEHQPLGGINRLRKAVYPVSAERRLRN
jgi:hypothetical protein